MVLINKKRQSNILDFLFAITVIAFVSLPASVELLFRHEFQLGFTLLTLAVILSVISIVIAGRWGKKGVHASLLGNILPFIIFIVSPFVAWKLGFSVIANIIISLYFCSKPTYLFLKGLYKKKITDNRP